MATKKFQPLVVWQQVHQFVLDTYRYTTMSLKFIYNYV